MLALQIKEIKAFMNKLLNSETFDRFLLEEARIQTGNTFLIDGHLNKAFYTREELEDPELLPYNLTLWKDMRSTCFMLIKGKKVPLLFKLTLIYNPRDSHTLLEQAGAGEYSSLLKSFVLTIKYDQKRLLLTTGTSFSTFIMDKTPDLIWDEALRRFLFENGIDFEEG
ncbi:MAG: hypothetical protein IJP31_02240 [Lachnospiraceae bacterium]|nr:hypothetical protein [Lachnospiraceae bacterium]